MFVGLPVEVARPFECVVQIASGQDTVVKVLVVFLYIEVYAAVAHVCVACIKNLLDGFDLFDDMPGSPRFDGRRGHVKKPHRLVVAERVGLHHFHRLKLLKSGFLCYLVLTLIGIMLKMTDIRDVAHIAHLVSKVPQQLAEDIVSYTWPRVPQMGIPVYGRAANIHSDMARVDGHEKFLSARKGIGKAKISHF